MPTVLVVEDESRVRELVSQTLKRAGYQVTSAADGVTAVDLALRHPPDLAVLDIRLPGIDGLEVCRQIRLRADTPVLFLTALKDEEQIIRALRLGGDDYLTKPFSPRVLVAHVQALLRRTQATVFPRVVRLLGLTINLANAEVYREEARVHLTATEFRILATLARHLGDVVTSPDLLRAAQGYELPRAEAHEIVKVHIRNLRRKIEPNPRQPHYVLTVRGLGYMLRRGALEAPA